MLFYATLLITSLLVTVIILAVYNSVFAAYKKATALRKRNNPTMHLSEKKYGKNNQKASKSWGNPGSHAKPSALARTHPAVPEVRTPWGWPGSDHENQMPQANKVANTSDLNAYLSQKSSLQKGQTVSDWKHNVGRPARDQSPVLAGTRYKPSFVDLSAIDGDS